MNVGNSPFCSVNAGTFSESKFQKLLLQCWKQILLLIVLSTNKTQRVTTTRRQTNQPLNIFQESQQRHATLIGDGVGQQLLVWALGGQ